jgi:molecular chaperone GrpE (heat shock protein)
MNDIKTILAVNIKIQSLIHSIDDLSDSVIYKQKLKQESNRYLKTIEGVVDMLGNSFDKDEAEYFNSLVKKIDLIGDSIEIETKPK